MSAPGRVKAGQRTLKACRRLEANRSKAVYTEREWQPSPLPLEWAPRADDLFGPCGWERRFGHGTRRTQAGRHSRRGCRRLQPAHGCGRGRHARAAEGASARTDRPQDRRTSRAHRQDHRRRHAGRVRQRRRRGALCGRGAGGMAERNAVCRRTAASNFASAFNRAISSSRTATSSATASTSPLGLKAWPSPAASASRRGCRRMPRASSTLAFDDMGEQQLKNIARPVRVYRVRKPARRLREPLERPALPLPDKPSIAVLPFAEYERRPGAGIFRRRHGRGDHHRALAHPLAVRDRPQFELHLQGPSRRREAGRPRTRRALRARRHGAQGRQPGAHHRPADRYGDRRAYLGRPLRRRARRHLRAAGPGRHQRRRRDRAQAAANPRSSGPPASRPKASTLTIFYLRALAQFH